MLSSKPRNLGLQQLAPDGQSIGGTLPPGLETQSHGLDGRLEGPPWGHAAKHLEALKR